MECAYFVRRLRSGARTPWVLANIDKTHDVLPNLKRWGEAVGFKLQEIQNKESQPCVSGEATLNQIRNIAPLLHIAGVGGGGHSGASVLVRCCFALLRSSASCTVHFFTVKLSVRTYVRTSQLLVCGLYICTYGML